MMNSSESRQREMNDLFEKMKLYCDILRKSSSPEVGRWGEEDVDRALHWAGYFDKAILRISKSRSVTAKVDEKLKEFGRTRGWRLGTRELNFATFKQSSEYLTEALMNNPSLASQLKRKISSNLVKKEQSSGLSCDTPVKKERSGPSGLSCDTPVKKERSGPSGLSCDTPVKKEQSSGLSCDTPKHTTLSLLKHIERQRTFSSVCEQLEQLSSKDETIMDLLLKCLIEHEGTYMDTKKAIVRWLMQHSTKYNTIWKQPPELLAKISSLYLNFYKEYIKYLTNNVDQLETLDVTKMEPFVSQVASNTNNSDMQAVIPKTLTSTTKRLETIIGHFKALCAMRCDVNEVTVKFVRIQALKHCTASRFSYSTPLTTCVWTTVLHALSEQ